MYRLIFLNGPRQGESVEVKDLPAGGFTLGRGEQVALRLADGRASREHARILLPEGKPPTITDLGSANGTHLNGEPLTGTRDLKPNDVIRIGKVELRWCVAGSDANLPTELEIPGKGGKDGEAGEPSYETIAVNAREIARRPGQNVEQDRLMLRALLDIALQCRESGDPRELLQSAGKLLVGALEADRVWPQIFTDQGELVDVAEEPFGPGAKIKTGQAPSRTIIDATLRTHQAVRTDPRRDARFSHAPSISSGQIGAAICVPILGLPPGAQGEAAQGIVLGTLYADRFDPCEPFSDENLEVLAAAAVQLAGPMLAMTRMAVAMENVKNLRSKLSQQGKLIGNSTAMKDVRDFIQRVGPTEASILILGESGTGKELVAQAIHDASTRAEGPLEVVNCAAMTETLAESELFGHAKGSFTGANQDRAGRFEVADKGTLFLDEVGELTPACQTKLLRVLEQREFSRVGETRVRRANVRLIAATNRDLAAEVAAGRFRNDLYFRLNVVNTILPPLRDRAEDVGVLLDYFMGHFKTIAHRPDLTFRPEPRRLLLSYAWPGNIRELKNVCERLVILARGTEVTPEDLPPEVRTGRDGTRAPGLAPAAANTTSVATAQPGHAAGAVGAGPAADASSPASGDGAAGAPAVLGASLAELAEMPLAEIEKRHILAVLRAQGGNRKATADRLGIDRSTLYAKLKLYKIDE
ncbi:MAG: sigma 54-interacting transcriptional regulator [Planctomycetota bacterium]